MKKNKPELLRILVMIISFFTSTFVTDMFLGYVNSLIGTQGPSVNYGYFGASFDSYSTYYWNAFYFSLLISTLFVGLFTTICIDEKVKFYMYYNYTLRKTVRQMGEVKKKIYEVTYSIVEQDKLDSEKIDKRDEAYAGLLTHLRAEFDLEGVSVDSISNCIATLEDHINANDEIFEMYALTNLPGDSWLTRTMLLYLIRTVQLAGKITDRDKKFRLFIREEINNNDEAFRSVRSLHNGFLPTNDTTKQIFTAKMNPFKYSFLYLKTNRGVTIWTTTGVGKQVTWQTCNVRNDIDKIKELIENIKEEYVFQ